MKMIFAINYVGTIDVNMEKIKILTFHLAQNSIQIGV